MVSQSEGGLATSGQAFPGIRFDHRAYGTDITWIGDEGGMAARGHVPDLRFIAACNHMARQDTGLVNLCDDRYVTYEEARAAVKRVWAVPCQPEDGEEWCVTWRGITEDEDAPGAIPLTLWWP